LANKFIKLYELDDTINNLVVSMHVNVISSCDRFAEDANNKHVVTLKITLTLKTVNIEMTTSASSLDSKILACESANNKTVFKTLSIIFGILDIVLAVGLVIFIYLTRNTDINYSIKVKKIINSYRSYIQKITNIFDFSEYQLLMVSSFNEMLDIRDTIQSPILMCENEDHTCTTFYIPTHNNLLYAFEIKVDDYDELYNDANVSSNEES